MVGFVKRAESDGTLALQLSQLTKPGTQRASLPGAQPCRVKGSKPWSVPAAPLKRFAGSSGLANGAANGNTRSPAARPAAHGAVSWLRE